MEPFEGKMKEPSTSANIFTKLGRIAELAKRAPDMKLRSLAHHIDAEWLAEAYQRTRKDGAVGVDGQTAEQYARDLEKNLESLLNRAKSGTYKAPPVRRVHIPKANGETRALGIPTFEDKVLQRAVAMVLGAVYEQDFLDCSYGFRPGRSAHDALDDLQNQLVKMGGGWLLEVDFRKFFDTLEHAKLKEILSQRVTDGVLLRLISKWLHAGVMERGELHFPGAGTPQGGVISPLLANVFLHEVLDLWFERDVKPRLHGQARLFRYADDAVMVFAHEKDARRFLEVLEKRCEKYGLVLHPEKTRLLDFRRPDRRSSKDDDDDDGSTTFDLLGFTHFWQQSLSKRWVVMRRTARDRFRRSVRAVASWCRKHRHDPVPAQRLALSRMINGHYAYYGIAFNARALGRFLYCATLAWWAALQRRSQRGMTWARMDALLRKLPLPQPRIFRPLKWLRSANP
jgi:group II intron reverse transcriptase/maturase